MIRLPITRKFNLNIVQKCDAMKLDSNWDFCLYQMGMEMERGWRWTEMEIENRISSLYQSMVSDRDGNRMQNG